MQNRGGYRLGSLVLVAGVLAASSAQALTIRFATEAAYPPYNTTLPNGKIGGFEPELIDAICKKIQANCTIIKNDWDSAFTNLDAKKYDVVADSVTINAERKQKWLFSTPYAKVPVSFVGKAKRFPYSYISAMELAGRKVGVQGGSSYDTYLQKMLKNAANVSRITYEKTDDMYKALAKGEIDVALDDMATTQESFLKDHRKDGFEFVGSPSRDKNMVGEGVGFVVRLSDKALKAQLDKGIEMVRQDGTLTTLAQKYFMFGIEP
ncbi:transporter substrate-binding domain-containing protein [Leeia sp. TBRC 13508]|uniref:Transporter substrate-binding domain-containing protein n=1 Tax=Leeia speluncae TaxID=2884804 RepID=A0ABS8D7J2_9NEIS|nr:transporter substrate-binding domain-containing protein [Leeia speluncae]MCB6184159.1 transporter substrate-binding domain-containing protein [Leeia speluncae]